MFINIFINSLRINLKEEVKYCFWRTRQDKTRRRKDESKWGQSNLVSFAKLVHQGDFLLSLSKKILLQLLWYAHGTLFKVWRGWESRTKSGLAHYSQKGVTRGLKEGALPWHLTSGTKMPDLMSLKINR